MAFKYYKDLLNKLDIPETGIITLTAKVIGQRSLLHPPHTGLTLQLENGLLYRTGIFSNISPSFLFDTWYNFDLIPFHNRTKLLFYIKAEVKSFSILK